MSNGQTEDWYDETKKTDAILRVLKHIEADQAAGTKCIGNDAEAHKLFEDPAIGNIKIPAGGRVVIFAQGEEKLREGSSVIIEMPPPPSATATTDRELLTYVLGDYKYWKP